MVPPEMEPHLFGELAIDVPITDMDIPIRLKTGFDVRGAMCFGTQKSTAMP